MADVITTWSDPRHVGPLYLVGGNRTPFLNLMGGLNGGNARVVPQFDYAMSVKWSLSSASQPAITETQSQTTAGYETSFDTEQEINTCQLYIRGAHVNDVAMANRGAIFEDGSGNDLSRAGVNHLEDMLGFQMTGCLKQNAFDYNHVCLNGTYQQATAANVAAKTRGFQTALTTNTVSGTGIDVTKANINQLLHTMTYTNGAPLDLPVIVTNGVQKTIISTLYGVQPRSWNVGGFNILTVQTDFAELGVLLEPNMPLDEIFILDMAHIRPVFCAHPSKGFMYVNERDTGGLATAYDMVMFAGIDYGTEKYHGRIYNLKSTF